MQFTHLLLGFILISTIGCICHFTYEWTKNNKIVAIFSAVNESVWEHIKIGLTGFIVWTFIDFPLYSSNRNYWLAKATSLLVFTTLIPSIYYLMKYSLKHATRKTMAILNIGNFFFAVAISLMISAGILSASPLPSIFLFPSFLIIFFTLSAYVCFTFVTPRLPWLFMDPRNSKYGFDANQTTHSHLHPQTYIKKSASQKPQKSHKKPKTTRSRARSSSNLSPKGKRQLQSIKNKSKEKSKSTPHSPARHIPIKLK